MDDALVTGKSFAEQLAHLYSVFQRLRTAGLKLALEKCFLFKRKLKYLGHVMSEEGIATDPEKIDAVKSWPKAANAKELRSFIKFCSYCRRFIAGFTHVVQPLYNCLEGTLFCLDY